MIKIPFLAIKAATEKTDDIQLLFARWGIRQLEMTELLLQLSQRNLKTVGDVRMMMNDELDKLVAGHDSEEEVEIIN